MAKNIDKNKGDVIALLLIVVVFLLIGGIFYASQFFKAEEKLKIALDNGQIISFCFANYNENREITKTLVLFYSANTNKVSIVSILPKTYISFNRNSSDYMTIEEAFNKRVTNNEFKDAIGKFLGTKIDYYVYMDNESFIKFIDILEGVEIQNRETINDAHQNVYISSGDVLFNGDKALEYASYIKDDKLESYYQHLNKIQDIVKGLLKVKENFLENFDEYGISNYLHKLITTNLSQEDIKIIYNGVRNRFENGITDFSKGIIEIIVYCDRKNIEGNDYILQPKNSGNWVKGEIQDAVSNLKKEEEIDNSKLVIEIKNGTNIVGLALRTKKHLESFGIKVTDVSNADSENYQNTMIIIRNSEQKSQKLGELIRCKQIIKLGETNNRKIDATLILGKDFDGRIVRR